MKAGKFIKREARIITEMFDEKMADGIKPESGLIDDEWSGLKHQTNEACNSFNDDEKSKILKYINERFNLKINLDDSAFSLGDREIQLREYRSTKQAGCMSPQDLEDINNMPFREKIGEILAVIPGGMQHFRDIAEVSPFLF